MRLIARLHRAWRYYTRLRYTRLRYTRLRYTWRLAWAKAERA